MIVNVVLSIDNCNFVEQVLMVGDDIVSDIGGAKACGLVGVQVRTGKYRLSIFVLFISIFKKRNRNIFLDFHKK